MSSRCCVATYNTFVNGLNLILAFPSQFSHCITHIPGAADRLEYLKELGVNAICMLPPTQDSHAVCWGYDPISLFAVHRQVQFAKPYSLPLKYIILVMCM